MIMIDKNYNSQETMDWRKLHIYRDTVDSGSRDSVSERFCGWTENTFTAILIWNYSLSTLI